MSSAATRRPVPRRMQSVLTPSNLRNLPRAELQAISSDGQGTILHSICVFVQSIVGGGLLAYPAAMADNGPGNVFVLQTMVLWFVCVGLVIIADCVERTRVDTYQALTHKLLGRRAEIACEVMLIVLIFGASVVYLDICVDQIYPWISSAFSSFTKKHHDHADGFVFASMISLLADRQATTVMLAVLAYFICLARSIAALSVPALLGFMSLLYVTVVIVANYFEAVGDEFRIAPTRSSNVTSPFSSFASSNSTSFAGQPGHAPDAPVWWHDGISSWLRALPVICFSYQGHISAVPLYAELKTRSMTSWYIVVGSGLLVCVAVYNSSGLLGYLTFLDKTKHDILSNFDEPHSAYISQGFITVARGAVAMAVMTTFAVFQFCARAAILNEVGNFLGIKEEEVGGDEERDEDEAEEENVVRGGRGFNKKAARDNEKGVDLEYSEVTVSTATAAATTSTSTTTTTTTTTITGSFLCRDNGGDCSRESLRRSVSPRNRVRALSLPLPAPDTVNDANIMMSASGATRTGAAASRNSLRVSTRTPLEGTWFFPVTTAAWCALVTLVSLIVPDIGSMIAIVGNFSCFFMFHFPGLMLISVVGGELREVAESRAEDDEDVGFSYSMLEGGRRRGGGKRRR